MPIGKDRLINEMRNRLDLLFPEPDLGWTEAVKIALCEACKACDPQCQLYASGVRRVEEEGGLANGGEWLFDVTCLQYDSDGYLRRVPLVAESEWSRRIDDIYSDFEKLLVACADVRVMVFDGTIWSGDDNKFDEFSAYITKSEHAAAGDTYLLAAWLPDGFEYCHIEAFRRQRLLD